ncbi:MAG: hypothetical protein HC799_18170 [Limnothrix sp. RL_2_0]|nr:hypothetical protein [Limnothrix sp. RL_2_0]
MNKIIKSDENYSFSKFFELKISAKDLAKEFGYSFERTWLNLPQYSKELDRCQETLKRIEEILPYVDLSTEQARREWLISPMLMDLIHYTKVEIQVEYSIRVNQQLQGIFDYFLESSKQVVIVEAKKSDLDFGMTQLISELIALDSWLEKDSQLEIIGAVTTGKIWEFACLSRQDKYIQQGLESYGIPGNFEELMRILIYSLILEK